MFVAVLLTFRRPAEALLATVRGVLDAGGIDALMVIDNGDRAPTALSEVLDDPRVSVHVASHNLGYAGGMNLGIRAALAAGATRIVLLNDDLTVALGWLTPLASALDADDTLGAVQPMLVQTGVEPAVVNSMGVVVGDDGAGVDLHRGEPADRSWPAIVPIERFTGGAVLLRSAFVRDVGLFDERYFLYYEDVDLGARGARRGWTYACVTASRVRHEGSASTAQLGDRQRFYQERNRLWCTFAHGSVAQIRGALWLSVRRLRHAPRAVHARALLSGLAGAPRAIRHRA